MKEVKLKGLYTACFYLYYILEKEKYRDRNQKWPGAWGQGRELSTKPDSKQKYLC